MLAILDGNLNADSFHPISIRADTSPQANCWCLHTMAPLPFGKHGFTMWEIIANIVAIAVLLKDWTLNFMSFFLKLSIFYRILVQKLSNMFVEGLPYILRARARGCGIKEARDDHPRCASANPILEKPEQGYWRSSVQICIVHLFVPWSCSSGCRKITQAIPCTNIEA